MAHSKLEAESSTVASSMPVESDHTGADPRVGNTGWCSCKNCIPMPTPEESFCCREVEKLKKYFIRGYTCITQVEELLQLISEEKILPNSYRNLGQVTDKQLQKVLSSMRRDAYRNFTSWTHGSLGSGNRIPEPSCVVNLIRGKYPDPDGNYMGFRKEPDTAEDISNS